jgi:hypothetical protein
MKSLSVALIALLLTGCGKLGVSGHISQAFGNWAQVNLPEGCKPKQISAEEGSGTAVLCEDGRVFH